MRNKIENLREKIDTIDKSILELLVRRKNLCVEIGKIKMSINKKIKDDIREQQIIKRLKNLAKQKDLNEKFVTDLFRMILKQSKKDQKHAII